MTYIEYISQFIVFDNPPKKDGYDRHHIIPESEQVKMHGSVTDNRQIYVTPAQHLWAHILYDREHGTNTADWFLKLCGKPADYFDCWEKCLAYAYTFRKKREERDKKVVEACRTPEHRQKLSKAHTGKSHLKGEKNPCYGRTGEKHPMYGELASNHGMRCFNNGIKNTYAFECPEGYKPGMIRKKAV